MGQNNPYRNSSDKGESTVHARATGEGHSGGNAGAGKSGGEDMGSEKKIDDERFGSREAGGVNHQEDEGKRDAPGRRDADSIQDR